MAYYMGPGMMGGGHGLFMGYGWVFQLIVLFLLLLIFLWLLRGQRFGYEKVTTETPSEIVRRRYAAGEITKKEYHALLQDLREDSGKG